MDGPELVAQDVQEDCASHSGSLLPAVHALLQSASCPFLAVEGLAVSIGPGSFTGLRAGLATMIGFRLVTGLPLAAVPTLEAMAWRYRPGGCSASPLLCPMLTAGAGAVYWARFQWRDGRLVRLTEDRVGAVQAVIDAIRQPTMLWGEGWRRHRTVFAEALGARALCEQSEAPHAAAREVGLAGAEALRTGRIAGPKVSPHYVQPSEAERLRDRAPLRVSP